MSLNETPRANRLHIGIFGRRNSGKSSLINAVTDQNLALVSDVAGTTTDPVYKSMEIHGIGPVILIDTAGFDDEGTLGELRVSKTHEAADKTDMALMVFDSGECGRELEWFQILKKKGVPVITVLNKTDILSDPSACAAEIKKITGIDPILVSAKERSGIDKLREEMIRRCPDDYEQSSITGTLCSDGDVVLLVMPQDIQAPKGRLILPQVQTLRELLDKKCVVVSCTTDKMDSALAGLREDPKLIITDSQAFMKVFEKKPPESRLTSFSVLFAAYKGDIGYFVESVLAIEKLTENSRVLIAEACAHAPIDEDIGRVKIPAMLRKRVGEGLTVEFVRGVDFPADLTPYDLIIHCGACMFNRRYVMHRVEAARKQRVPMTNYGVTIAYLGGILDKIDFGA